MRLLQQLESLIATLERDIEAARRLKSPNPEDDLAIKAAIVGFSRHSPTEEWGHEHYGFVRNRLEADYKVEDLHDWGPKPENLRLFVALCFGYLLGLFQAGEVTEHEVRVAEAQIAGLIALNCEVLCSDCPP